MAQLYQTAEPQYCLLDSFMGPYRLARYSNIAKWPRWGGLYEPARIIVWFCFPHASASSHGYSMILGNRIGCSSMAPITRIEPPKASGTKYHKQEESILCFQWNASLSVGSQVEKFVDADAWENKMNRNDRRQACCWTSRIDHYVEQWHHLTSSTTFSNWSTSELPLQMFCYQ